LEIDPADGSFTSSECVIVDGVYTITNTYKPPTRDYYMKKAWDGGKPRSVTGAAATQVRAKLILMIT